MSSVSRTAIEETSATTIWRSWICQLELRSPRRVWWGNGNAARLRLNLAVWLLFILRVIVVCVTKLCVDQYEMKLSTNTASEFFRSCRTPILMCVFLRWQLGLGYTPEAWHHPHHFWYTLVLRRRNPVSKRWAPRQANGVVDIWNIQPKLVDFW